MKEVNKNTEDDNTDKKLHISDVISSYLTKEKFVKYFLITPLFLLGLHIGYILAHILSNFSFVIPIFIRITGVLTGVYVWGSIILYSKIYQKLEK